MFHPGNVFWLLGLSLCFPLLLNFTSHFGMDLSLLHDKQGTIFSFLSVHFQTSKPTSTRPVPELRDFLLQELQLEAGRFFAPK